MDNITRYYLTICFIVDIFSKENNNSLRVVKKDEVYEEESISVIGR